MPDTTFLTIPEFKAILGISTITFKVNPKTAEHKLFAVANTGQVIKCEQALIRNADGTIDTTQDFRVLVDGDDTENGCIINVKDSAPSLGEL